MNKTTKKPKPLLNNPELFPTEQILKETLADSYVAFEELNAILTNSYDLTFNWKYYNDSKAWLCKVAYKKKTIFWLSVWKEYFKINFYFMERHLAEILELEVNENNFEMKKEGGRMHPLSFYIKKSEQFVDLLKIVEYKKNAK